tara:strand:+ start:1330 stop:1524 length:195 start_codon:yes stop_codon:yes gene_type:complete
MSNLATAKRNIKVKGTRITKGTTIEFLPALIGKYTEATKLVKVITNDTEFFTPYSIIKAYFEIK